MLHNSPIIPECRQEFAVRTERSNELKATRRIASDARYIVASIALVTSMAVFASLGSIRRHEEPSPVVAVAPEVATPAVTDDCTCGTSSTVQVYTSTTTDSPQNQRPSVTISTTTSTSTDDC